MGSNSSKNFKKLKIHFFLCIFKPFPLKTQGLWGDLKSTPIYLIFSMVSILLYYNGKTLLLKWNSNSSYFLYTLTHPQNNFDLTNFGLKSFRDANILFNPTISETKIFSDREVLSYWPIWWTNKQFLLSKFFGGPKILIAPNKIWA